MNPLIIPADELDYADEYDPMHEVYYRGEPFSGVSQTARETIEYHDGKADGRYALTFSDGSPSATGTYAQGECLTMTSWYEGGNIRETYRAEGVETSRWDQNGTLRYQAGEDESGTYQQRWFGNNGSIKQHYTAGQGTDYFANNGRLAMRVTFGHSLNTVNYTDEVLTISYLDILTGYPDEANLEKSNANWYFWGWVWQKLEKRSERATAMAILHHLDSLNVDTARRVLAKIKTVNLDTFRSSMSYHIQP